MRRRLFVLLLLSLILSSASVPAHAVMSRVVPYIPVAEEDIFYPQASNTIDSCGASAGTASDGSGGLFISFSVDATALASQVGVQTIEVYRVPNTLCCTLQGSTTNGMIFVNALSASGTRALVVESGYYYAKVQVFSTIGSMTDSRTITTNTVYVP